MEAAYIYKIDTENWSELFARIGADKQSWEKLSKKNTIVYFYLKGISSKAANIIKQEALSKGGEAVIGRKVLASLDSFTDILLSLNQRQLDVFLGDLMDQPFGLVDISKRLSEIYKDYRQDLPDIVLKNSTLSLKNGPLIMGILNVTPDSFSDGGKFFSANAALQQAATMIEQGVDIIDVGGESTRPGSKEIDSDEELARVLPVVESISNQFSQTPISIDTKKAIVAEKAIEAGASIINDVSAGTADKNMFAVAKDKDCPIILMHSLKSPETMQENINYTDLLSEIYIFLDSRVKQAINFGIKKEKIIIDPGIGFGKTWEQNLKIINHLSIFKSLGCTILIGPSKKRFIGEALGREADLRLWGTAAVVSSSVWRGANIIRIHDVKAMKDVAKMTNIVIKEKFDA